MQKKNWFVRILVILLILFVAAIIVVSFFLSESKYIITAPIICLVAILVVLALSEIFDNFSVGSFLSLKKEHKKVEHELQKTEQENKELRLQLTNIVTNLNSNSNITLFGHLPEYMERTFGVKKAQDDEVQQKEQEEETVHNLEVNNENSQELRLDYSTRRRITNKIEDFILSQYCLKNDIKNTDVYREIKFSEGFIDNDPIMERNIIFDAYYKAPWKEEIFIEVCHHYNSPSMLDRFYHLLSKVYHYRNAKKLHAKLVLLVPKLSENKETELFYSTRGITKERFCEYFAPAIKNNLLEIIEIEISDAEIDKIKKQVSPKTN